MNCCLYTTANSVWTSLRGQVQCGGLAAIFYEKFHSVSGHISETVRDRIIVAINHYYRNRHIRPFTLDKNPSDSWISC